MKESVQQYYNTEQLPKLILKRTGSSSNFITEEIYLEASGWTLEQAKDGLAYLLKELKELNK